MKSTKAKSTGGEVTYWTTGETNLDAMRNRLTAIEPDMEKLIPNASTPTSALKEALHDVYPNHLVRGLDNEGFAVVHEYRGETENTYQTIASAWFMADGETIETGGCDQEQSVKILKAYRGHRGILQPAATGRFLSRVVNEFLGGTILRRTGGIYWLPDQLSKRWKAIAEAVEATAIKDGSTVVYNIRHEMNELAVRAVHDAIVHEMNSNAERISNEIIEGKLGANALKTRETETVEMLNKVERYEQILDVALSDVRAVIGEVKNAAAAAAIMASAAKPEPVAA